jgi:hypothetical protein
MAPGLSLTDAARLFEGLAGSLPQSAKELKASYRVWMKAHHPDITGRHDPLSLEAVQWMNAAYDVLKTQDWTQTRREPNHADTTAHGKAEWTDVGGSSRSYKSRRQEEQLRRWREQQQRKRREEEQQRERQAEQIRRRNEELKRRSFWQSVLWGPDSLENPGFLWCCFHLLSLVVGTVISLSIIMFIAKMVFGTLYNFISHGFSGISSEAWVFITIILLPIIGFGLSTFLALWKSFRKLFRTI